MARMHTSHSRVAPAHQHTYTYTHVHPDELEAPARAAAGSGIRDCVLLTDFYLPGPLPAAPLALTGSFQPRCTLGPAIGLVIMLVIFEFRIRFAGSRGIRLGSSAAACPLAPPANPPSVGVAGARPVRSALLVSGASLPLGRWPWGGPARALLPNTPWPVPFS